MSITLREYQSRVALWLAPKKRGLVVAPAGSGKTLCAAGSLVESLRGGYLVAGDQIGWCANTVEQVDQGRKAVGEFEELKCLNFRFACAAAQQDWSDCETLVGDEIHHLSDKSDGIWLAQAQTCKGAIWGFTATPDLGDPDRYQWLLNFFNRQVFEVSRKDCAHNISKAKVIMVDVGESDMQEKMDEQISKQFKRLKEWHEKTKTGISEDEIWMRTVWQHCSKTCIVQNERRNDSVIEIAQRHAGDSTIILVNQIEHGQALCDRLSGAVMCFAAMGRKKRQQALEAFSDGTLNCLIATSLLNEGADLPRAKVLIMVSGGRSNAQVTQKTGRVLRKFTGKDEAVIYDFEDDSCEWMRKHSLARQALYRRLGYEIIHEEINQPELAV